MPVEFCSYAAVSERLGAGTFPALVSILGTGDGLSWPCVSIPHLRLAIDDIAAPMRGYSFATTDQIRQLLEFGLKHPTPLVHCRAGTSRSAAAALLLELQGTPVSPGSVVAFVQQFQSRFPFARPNQRIIECGDAVLGFRAELRMAVRTIFS